LLVIPAGVISMNAVPSTGTAGGGGFAIFLVLVALFVIVGVAVKLEDLRRKRESEAVHLQAQISDALLREAALFGLPITPSAHVPFWRGAPATIEVTGHAPTPELHAAVMRVVEEEARRIRADVRIVDRIEVPAVVAARVA
jgi:hypothetical protein